MPLDSSTQLPKVASNKQSATQKSHLSKSWSNVNGHSSSGQQLPSTGVKQSGPINYYQYAQAPFYNFRSPMPSSTGSSSGSFSSLINNLISPFNKVMSRRAANGKLFSLAEQFNNPSTNNNALGALEYSPSVANLEALNEAVNNVMLGFNGLQPQQANQLAGQLSSYLAGADAGLKNGKKLLDFPKQWYKLLGEKLSGAGEAAYTATVPLKDTFMHTLKSFYSYIKPSRSQSSSSSPFADAANMVAAAAAAQESLLAGSLNGASGQNQNSNGNNNNPKRRQSDSYSGYYFNINNNKMSMPPPGSSVNAQNYPTGRYNHGVYHGHHQQSQMQQSKSSMQQGPQGRLPSVNGKMNQIQSHGPNSGDMLTLDTQIHASSANGKHYYSSGHHMSKYSDPNIGKSPYDQVLNQVINAQIQGYNMNPKQPNALYQKSKEIFSRFTKKRVTYPQYNFNGNAGNSLPMMADYVHSYQPRLPSQTINKVANKLPTLPLIYNNGQQQEQSQLKQTNSQQQSAHAQQLQSHQSKNSVKSASQAYYTQQPINQNPFGIQPVYPPPSQPQSAGTASISSTSSPLSTITSVSMSMHQSIGTSYDNMDNVDPQHIQYLLPSNDKQMKNYLDEISGSSSSSNSNNNKNDLISSSSNNQESVAYYYDAQSIRQDQPNNQQSNGEQSSTSQQQDSEDSSNQKKK